MPLAIACSRHAPLHAADFEQQAAGWPSRFFRLSAGANGWPDGGHGFVWAEAARHAVASAQNSFARAASVPPIASEQTGRVSHRPRRYTQHLDRRPNVPKHRFDLCLAASGGFDGWSACAVTAALPAAARASAGLATRPPGPTSRASAACCPARRRAALLSLEGSGPHHPGCVHSSPYRPPPRLSTLVRRPFQCCSRPGRMPSTSGTHLL